MIYSFDKEKFIYRYRQIRYSYGMRNAQMIKLLELKSQSSITNIDKGDSLPSLDFICSISKIYGVSIDYLFGISDIPYTEESVLAAERAFFTKIEAIYPISKKTLEFYHYYFDELTRPKYYSLPCRANILTLSYFFGIPRAEELARLTVEDHNPLLKDKDYLDLESYIPPFSIDVRKMSVETAYCLNLHRLLSWTNPIVIYDITEKI